MAVVSENDPLDFGIVHRDYGVSYFSSRGKKIEVNNGAMVNPFFVGSEGGSVANMEFRDIYGHFTRVLVMCVGDNPTNDAYKIYDATVMKNDFPMIGRQFHIFSGTISMLRLRQHKNNANVVSRDVLSLMFPTQQFDSTEIVVPLYELTRTSAETYVSLFDTSTSITDINTLLQVSDHYAHSYKRPIENQLISRLSDLRESQFWTDPSNCGLSITKLFTDRRFNFKQPLEQSKLNSILGKQTNETTEVVKGKEVDYMNMTHNKNVYIDIYSAMKDSGKRTYFATVDHGELKVKKDDITNLVCSLTNEKELFSVFNSLLVSKDYCHMVLNNSQILSKVAPLMQKHKALYKYLMGYAWMCFYIEECIFKTKSIKDSRFVFDITTANKLPVFPFCINDPWQNPYFTVLIDSKLVDMPNNCLSVGFVDNHDGYGVCTLEQFKWRFNLFTTSDPNRNILDGIDWQHFAVSGSVIPACLQRKPVLLDLVAPKDADEKTKWLTFFTNYYSNSDIDLMCNDLSIFGFIEKAMEAFKIIRRNIPDCTDNDVQLEPIKTLAISVTKKFVEERVNDINSLICKNWDVETILRNIQNQTFEMKDYFYNEYTSNKRKMNTSIRTNAKTELDNEFIRSYMKPSSFDEMQLHLVDYELLKDEYQPFDSDLCFYLNDVRETKVSPSENQMVMKISENIKFKIRSQKMMKTIELFRAKSNDFFGVVGRFHLPCVRAYYQGDNVYILPSCITALMTGINIEYKYFAGVRDPIDIINKYRMRGFGTLLNVDEKKHMIQYNSDKNKVSKLFLIEKHDAETHKKYFGQRDINDSIFKPLVVTQGLPADVYNTVQKKYITTIDELRASFKRDSNYDSSTSKIDMFRFTTVNSDGTINPLDKWVVEAFCETK